MFLGSGPFDIAPGATAAVDVWLRGEGGLVPVVSPTGGQLAAQAEVLTGVEQGIPSARTTPITVVMPVR
jgi:hypothetical protein